MSTSRSLMKLAAAAGTCLALWVGLPGSPGSAQIGPDPPGPTLPDRYRDFSSCEDMKAQCAVATAEEIYDAAILGSSGQPLIKVGVCYIHDKTNCPDCACHNYIKQTWRGGDKGYDGGTGCVRPPRDPVMSKKVAAELIKQMCVSGQCCCPVVEPKPCPNPNPVYRCDVFSESCCSFPNECSAPGPAEGWHG